MTTTDISNYADTIDTRDIIERLDELDDAIAELEGDNMLEPSADDRDTLDDLRTERAPLHELIQDIGPESQYGVTLIRDSYFKEYAMEELADDLGAIPSNVQWPLTCIDWDKAARELQYDYSAVDYDGVTYWFQS